MTFSSLLLAFVALAVVLGLIWLAQHLARIGLLRLPQPATAGSPRLARVATLALDPRRRLHLVACDGRMVVLLTGGPHDLVVGWLPPEQGA